jgi:hypothetical protein
MTSHTVDTNLIKSLVSWLGDEAASIPPLEQREMGRSMSEIDELKRRIAAGEYNLDAGAIAEAMFSHADSSGGATGHSEVLEAGDGDGAPGGIDEL